jgi:predicted Zn-dependent protease
VQIGRVLAIVLAVVVCAWFALGIRQAHDIAQATDVVAQTHVVGAAQVARAESLLRTAATLNPDTEVDVLRAQLAIRQDASARAKRILESVVRREPMNLVAWDLLATVSGGDSRSELEALTHVAHLDPFERRTR